MSDTLNQAIARATGSDPVRTRSLGGGSVATVVRVSLANGLDVVAKSASSDSGADSGADNGLDIEGYMLGYLARHTDLPVPRVLHSDASLLIMEYIEAGEDISTAAQINAADLIADLHDITDDHFGFDSATLIGGLPQPNPPQTSWLDFFRDHRLMYMGTSALAAGRLPAPLMARIESFAGHLDRWIGKPDRPSLLHGDLWGGNVLCRNGRIAAFIDPALYFGDSEIELAFTTLFGTFGNPFFDRYREHHPIRPGFFEQRRDLYNLYPLLVHVRLFGGSYVSSVETTLKKFGF